MSNYFRAGMAIVELLEQSNLFKKVAFLQSMNDISENRQTTPACYVVYRGDNVPDTAGRGQRTKITQRYSVILAVANARSQTDTIDTVQEAGELIPKLLALLQGITVSEHTSPLVRVPGDMAGFSNSFSYFPFTFETMITF